MTEEQLEKLKYPLGRLAFPENFTAELFSTMINDLKEFPALLANEVSNLNEEQLNTPYREGGWTLRQVVHHLADSHMTAFLRFKMALTEENPTVKGYKQDLFSKTADVMNSDLKSSLSILEGVHHRWSTLLNTMSAEKFERTFYHTEYDRTYILKNVLALYSWHGKHHLAHIINLKKTMSW